VVFGTWQDLLAKLGVPASIIDPLNTLLKPLVDAGYSRLEHGRRWPHLHHSSTLLK
jgi:hypothetical protein